MKRKASALNQELRADEDATTVAEQVGAEGVAEDSSKRFKPDEKEAGGVVDASNASLAVGQEDREASPPSSRRTSPRMPARRIVGEVA